MLLFCFAFIFILSIGIYIGISGVASFVVWDWSFFIFTLQHAFFIRLTTAISTICAFMMVFDRSGTDGGIRGMWDKDERIKFWARNVL